MKTKVIVALLVVALAVAAGVVVAQGARAPAAAPAPGPGGPGGPACKGFGFGPRLAAQLDLTQDQINQLKQIRDDCLAATQGTRDQIRAKAKEMVELWTAEQPNAAAIKAAAADIDALRAEVRNACIDHALAGLNVLTPDQREKLRTMVKNHPGYGLGMGMGMCGGMGFGHRAGMGKGMWPGHRMGPQDGTGPRGGTWACPRTQ